jgi:hypothetical protein
MAKKNDKRVIACNYVTNVSAARNGALCYVCFVPGSADRVLLLVRSRGHRWIQKWEMLKRLDNFRFKTLPPEHPRYNDIRITDYDCLDGSEVDFLNWILENKRLEKQ